MSNLFGNPSIQLVRTRREYAEQSGYSTVQVYRGIVADLEGQFGILEEIKGVRFSLTPEDRGPFGTLEVRLPDAADGGDKSKAEPMSVQWDLQSNTYEKSLLEAPGMTEDLAAKVQAALNRVQNQNVLPSAILAENTGTGLGSDVANTIFKLMCKRVVAFYTFAFVLVRNATLASGFAQKWPVSNVGKRYTTAQLIAAENVPNDLKFNLPEGEWLKAAPTISNSSKGQTNVVNTWIYALVWDHDVYPAFTPIPAP